MCCLKYKEKRRDELTHFDSCKYIASIGGRMTAARLDCNLYPPSLFCLFFFIIHSISLLIIMEPAQREDRRALLRVD